MKLLILGHAGHGKTTVAQLIAEQTGLTFKNSSELALEIFLYQELQKLGYNYSSKAAAYNCRVSPWMREIWFRAMAEYNRQDPARLAKEVLKHADMYVGMRAAREINASIKQNLFDHIIWVDNPNKPPEKDTSMELEYTDKMHYLYNGGAYNELVKAVEELVTCLNPLSHIKGPLH